MDELFKDIPVKVKILLIAVVGLIAIPLIVIVVAFALPVFIAAVQQGRSITLIPPTIGAYADPSIKKCAEVVRNTAEATKALSAELARLSELADKQQQELVAINDRDTAASSGYASNLWRDSR